MSNAAWCNVNDPETNVKGQIGHAFDSNDPDKQHFTQTRKVNIPTGNSYGNATYQERQEVTEIVDFCGYHWQKQNPFRPPAPIPIESEIESVEHDADESEAEMWRAKYEAERARTRPMAG
jgi:hypothetical protein